jgi:hypothetical protein
MVKGKIDTPDLAALTALPIFAGIELGVWSLELDVFGGFSFGQELLSLGGASITLSFVLVLLSIGALVAQGQLSPDNFSQEEWYVIGGSAAIVPLTVFVPAVESLMNMADVVPLIAWVAISGAAVYISYQG